MPRPKSKIPRELRWDVWERDNFTCHYCGSRRFLCLDHVVAESLGGDTTAANLVTACRLCNSRKGVVSYRVFRQTGGGRRRTWRVGPIHRELYEEIRLLAVKDRVHPGEILLKILCRALGHPERPPSGPDYTAAG
jgi:hypothetical protein